MASPEPVISTSYRDHMVTNCTPEKVLALVSSVYFTLFLIVMLMLLAAWAGTYTDGP